MGDDLSDRPGVVIFHKLLLAPSETFVARPAGFLRRYRPIFAGLRLDGAGRYSVNPWYAV